jgi:HlyD family secretion protein
MTQDTKRKPSPIAQLLAQPPGSTGTPNGGGKSASEMGGGAGMDKRRKKVFWTRQRFMMVGAIVAFVMLVGYALSTTTGGRKLNVDIERVTISTVEFGPFQEMVSATGNVFPRTSVFLDAEEGGKIDEIYVLEGETVEEGQPILRLVNAGLQMQLFSSETSRIEQINRLESTRFQVETNNLRTRQQLATMDYEIRRLTRDVERNEELFKSQAISEREYLQGKDEYEYRVRNRDLTLDSYRADSLRQAVQLEQMEKSIQLMEENFKLVNARSDKLTLRAPVAGILSQLNAELGELRSSGFRFGQVDMLDGVKVTAGVDEFHISRVIAGQRAITNPMQGSGAEYEMVVRRVFPEVANGRFNIDLDFVDPPEGIRRGQTIRFRLEMSDPEDKIVIPQGGFYQTTGGNWVYVMDESGTFATKQPIRLGRKNNQVYEVIEGLKEGDRVVTSSYDTYNEVDRLVFN